ncbi:MAG: DUF2007 domain-containing protein [Clostridia bacterium]|nr:DUF2007 domain-containing protein [Clostridia bacterium]
MNSLFGLDRPSVKDEDLALLATTDNHIQIMIWESLLQGADIPYLLKERGSGTVMKVIAGYSVFNTDIYVRKEQLEEARALLEGCEESSEEEAE